MNSTISPAQKNRIDILYPNLPNELYEFGEKGFFASMDLNFAEYIYDKSSVKSDEVYKAALLASHAAAGGSVCFNFSSPVLEEGILSEAGKIIPDFKKASADLLKGGIAGAEKDYTPLVVEDSSLYLRKYYNYEKILAEKIKSFSQREFDADLDILSKSLNALFLSKDNSKIDMQKIAAMNSVIRYFSIISGGPGTGKTTTVVKILILLIEQYLKKGMTSHIALTAPTGKAAAHLYNSVQEKYNSIVSETTKLENEQIKTAGKYLPEKSSTLHRLLKVKYGTPFFQYNEKNRLPYNIIVVDEVSMCDAALTSKFISACPDNAHVIFLGDRDQLASVQAGAVLADLCGEDRNLSEKTIEEYKKLFPVGNEDFTASSDKGIKDSVVFLHKSYRFQGSSGIGNAAAAVNENDYSAFMEILTNEKYSDINYCGIEKAVTSNTSELAEQILNKYVSNNEFLNGYVKYCKSKNIDEAFSEFKKFKILCAVRRGAYGVENVNVLTEKILLREKLLKKSGTFYHLMPVIITENDYSLKLYNGDIGICFKTDDDSGVRVYFEKNDPENETDRYRTFSPLQLGKWEKVFAMTVHKSQGSEYNDILMMLPEVDSPVLTSELIYTGITRARDNVVISGSEKVIKSAVEKKLNRMSGLRKLLY